MRRRRLLVGLPTLGLASAVLGTGCGGGTPAAGGKQVPFRQVQSVFAKYACASCHPGTNAALDLRPAHAYSQLVGIRAVEDPRLVRVVAGDPERSFLYLKIAGDPKLGDIPAIGARMPQGAPRMAQADIDVIRNWILQGAKDANGRTGGPRVATPGLVGSPIGKEASSPRGSGTIKGVVTDARHRPVAHALVTLLIRGPDQPGGEEHYRVASADGSGRYTLRHAPSGQYLLKAYAPRSIYLSRIVALRKGQTATIDFGLASRVVPNPMIARPKVTLTRKSTRLEMTVTGAALDANYTLAANRRTGVVFELTRPDGGPGRWSRTVPSRIPGPWVFLAVDHQCNISNFVEVSR